MKWLIAFSLPFFFPTAQVAAQEVRSLAFGSFSSPNVSSAAAEPQPAPQTTRDDAVRDTWELGLGFALVRFRSSPFTATLIGLDSSVSYYVRDHLAVEGDITSAFEAHSANDADAKYMFYGAGVKLSAGNRKLQPFVHALVGGVHIFPQTAFSNNGLGDATWWGRGEKIAATAVATRGSRGNKLSVLGLPSSPQTIAHPGRSLVPALRCNRMGPCCAVPR